MTWAMLPDAEGSPMLPTSSPKLSSQLADSTDGALSPGCGKMARLRKASHPASVFSVK